MRIQKALRLEISRVKGQSSFDHLFQQRLLNGKEKLHKINPAKIFADLLKRQARRITQDVTTCQPDTIAAHIARLDDLREIFRHALLHEFRETPEATLNEFPLNSAYTLADFLECLEHTRRTHRAPAFINWRDGELAQIQNSISCMAGQLSALIDERICPECRINRAEREAAL